MKIEDITLTTDAEDWVRAAFSKASVVGGGTFALVLDADRDDYVVKLTCSEPAYTALVDFSGSSTHFPRVVQHAKNQGLGRGGSFHALLMEKVSDGPLMAADIADFINRQTPHKCHPMGLLKTAECMRKGRLVGYPESLAEAIASLGNYALGEQLVVELNQRWNWGQRTDGTLVMLDLVHGRGEV